MQTKYTLKKIKALGSLQEALPVLSSLASKKTAEARKTLLHAVKHDNLDIRIHALKKIQKVGNTADLPALITALEKAKEPVMGSEEATIHEIYIENLCKAISDISGETYKVNNVNDVKEMDAVIKKLKSGS
jgi:hypothetical protein